MCGPAVMKHRYCVIQMYVCSFKGHVRACHNQDRNNHICHLCGYKTYANSVLKVHIESKHEKKKRFFCEHCDASFYYKVKLQEHVNSELFYPLSFEYYTISILRSAEI